MVESADQDGSADLPESYWDELRGRVSLLRPNAVTGRIDEETIDHPYVVLTGPVNEPLQLEPSPPTAVPSPGRIDPQAGPIAGAHFLERSVAPVWIMDGDGEIAPLGTAFVVGPGLWMTARHVVEAHLDLLGSGTAALLLPKRIAWKDGKRSVFFIDSVRFVSIGQQGEHDLAMLSTNFSDDAQFLRSEAEMSPLFAFLEFRFPDPGETVVAYGYSGQHVDGNPGFSSTLASTSVDEPFVIRQAFLRAEGTIGAVHHPSRDSALLRWPVVEAGHPSTAGMSGGPVLTNFGHDRSPASFVCGVVCTSVRAEDPGDEVSYASLLGPVLDLHCYVGGSDCRRFTVRELVDRGVIVASGARHAIARQPAARTPQDIELPKLAEGGRRIAVKFETANERDWT